MSKRKGRKTKFQNLNTWTIGEITEPAHIQVSKQKVEWTDEPRYDIRKFKSGTATYQGINLAQEQFEELIELMIAIGHSEGLVE